MVNGGDNEAVEVVAHVDTPYVYVEKGLPNTWSADANKSAFGMGC